MNSMGRPRKQGATARRPVAAKFTDKQMDLLQKAAAQKAVTVNELMRSAVLERARHIVNSSTDDGKTFLEKKAEEIALILYGHFSDETMPEKFREEPNTPTPVDDGEWGMWLSEKIDTLTEAYQAGGDIFMSMVLDALSKRAAERTPRFLKPEDYA